jgi:hypothetical protein
VFEYKLLAGPCPKSYGLHVAALAGIPPSVCAIAAAVGNEFEARFSSRFTRAIALDRSVDGEAIEGAGEGAAGGRGCGQDEEWVGDDMDLLLPLLGEVLSTGSTGLRDTWARARRLLTALGAVKCG